MKKRLTRIVAGVAIIGIFLALAIWLGGRSVDERVEQLSAQAEAMGMSLSFDPIEGNPGAERLRNILGNFRKLGIDLDTEDPSELEVVSKSIRYILPTAYALSECETYGAADWPHLNLAAFQAVLLLAADGNRALADKDLEQVLRAAAAIRRVAHLVPRDEEVSCSTISIFARQYCSLIQRAAESFGKNQIDEIAREAGSWEIHNFETAAAHLAASRHRAIDDTAASPNQGVTPTERIEHTVRFSGIGVKKQKMFALSEAIKIFPKWSDDAFVMGLSESNLVSLGGVAHRARFLKGRELELRSSFAALWATIHARSTVLNGGSWPTIAQLEELGIQAADPVSGEPYEWREFEGKKRLFGSQHGEGQPEKGFLLLSDAERSRSRSSPP